MKREGKTKGRKTKIWLAALIGGFLIGIAGTGGDEPESELVDRNIPVTTEESEYVLDREEPEFIVEVLPEVGDEVTKALIAEPIATSEPMATPTSTPTPTPEPTATPTPTPEPTSTSAPTPESTPEPTPAPTIEPVIEKVQVPAGTDYILNKNTKKFHYPDCRSVKQMKEKNKKYYTGTRDECISMGYDPCGNCTP